MSIVNKGAKSKTAISSSPEYAKSVPVYSWFDVDEVRGKTADRNPATVIVRVQLGYEKDNKTIQTELVARTPQIIDLVRRYFSEKPISELGSGYEMEIKEELKRRINQIMSQGKVQDIAIIEYNIIEF
jgi:flagellar basal body-associated protein FliL